MQKTKKLFTILLVLPAICWMLLGQVSLHIHSFEKTNKSKPTKESKIPAKYVVSEQSTYQSSPTPTFDFPSDFVFKTIVTIEFPIVKQTIKNHFTFAKNKIFAILFTQYISTLAP